jgi:hypothetical protein
MHRVVGSSVTTPLECPSRVRDFVAFVVSHGVRESPAAARSAHNRESSLNRGRHRALHVCSRALPVAVLQSAHPRNALVPVGATS